MNLGAPLLQCSLPVWLGEFRDVKSNHILPRDCVNKKDNFVIIVIGKHAQEGQQKTKSLRSMDHKHKLKAKPVGKCSYSLQVRKGVNRQQSSVKNG